MPPTSLLVSYRCSAPLEPTIIATNIFAGQLQMFGSSGAKINATNIFAGQLQMFGSSGANNPCHQASNKFHPGKHFVRSDSIPERNQ